MEGQSKYLALYNGLAIPFDDIRDFVVNKLGFDVIPKDDGGWKIVINGETITMTYSNKWTRGEVIDDFLGKMLLVNNVEQYVYGLYFYEAIK